MGDWVHLTTDFGIILILIVGISQFRTPRGARFGNGTAAFALVCALVAVAYRNPIMSLALVIGVAALSAAAGSWVALRVNMIQIPAMVAFQHGAGGVAAFLVASVELTRAGRETLTSLGEASGILGLVVGAATFSGSMIAAGKLANRIKQTPTLLRRHNSLLLVIAAVIVAFGLLAGLSGSRPAVAWALVVLAVVSILLGGLDSVGHRLLDPYRRCGHAGADLVPERHRRAGRRALWARDPEPVAHRLRRDRSRLRVDSDARHVRGHESRSAQRFHRHSAHPG
jgi:NAD(P) transhydrogenase subunit beta